MELDVLSRGDVAEAARVARRHAGKRAHLRRGDDPLRGLDAHHLDAVLTLPVGPAHEPESPPVRRGPSRRSRTCPASRRTRRCRARWRNPDSHALSFSGHRLRPYFTSLLPGSSSVSAADAAPPALLEPAPLHQSPSRRQRPPAELSLAEPGQRARPYPLVGRRCRRRRSRPACLPSSRAR